MREFSEDYHVVAVDMRPVSTNSTVVKFTHKGSSFYDVLHVDPYKCRSVAKNFGCCTSV